MILDTKVTVPDTPDFMVQLQATLVRPGPGTAMYWFVICCNIMCRVDRFVDRFDGFRPAHCTATHHNSTIVVGDGRCGVKVRQMRRCIDRSASSEVNCSGGEQLKSV